jgi:hypothetical protein
MLFVHLSKKENEIGTKIKYLSSGKKKQMKNIKKGLFTEKIKYHIGLTHWSCKYKS